MIITQNLIDIISKEYNIDKTYLAATIDGDLKVSKIYQWVQKNIKFGTSISTSELNWLKKAKPIIFDWFKTLKVTTQENWSEYNVVQLATSCALRFPKHLLKMSTSIDIFEDILVMYYENINLKSYQGWLNRIWVYLAHIIKDDILAWANEQYVHYNAYVMDLADEFTLPEVVEDLLTYLLPLEKEVIEASFGLGKYNKAYSIREVADMLNSTKDIIFARKRKAIQKMRRRVIKKNTYLEYLVETLDIRL